jgi:hypothetical protein
MNRILQQYFIVNGRLSHGPPRPWLLDPAAAMASWRFLDPYYVDQPTDTTYWWAPSAWPPLNPLNPSSMRNMREYVSASKIRPSSIHQWIRPLGSPENLLNLSAMRNRQERVGTSLIRSWRARKFFFSWSVGPSSSPPLWLTPKIVRQPQSGLTYYI